MDWKNHLEKILSKKMKTVKITVKFLHVNKKQLARKNHERQKTLNKSQFQSEEVIFVSEVSQV